MRCLLKPEEIPGVEETFQSFLALCSASATRRTRGSLQELTGLGLNWMSFEKWRDAWSVGGVGVALDFILQCSIRALGPCVNIA